ncbi:MAG: hypothetical protein SVU32_07290 [Candidatus Nanohaloarchaea archaeon]|nr:hypothetical protein [Candidatus Nanohaloarchaea archaeon]
MVQPTQQYAGEEGNPPPIRSSIQKVLVLLLTAGLLATIGAAAVTVSTNVQNPPMSLSHEIVRNRTGGLAVLIHSYSSQDQYRIMQSKDVGGTQWQEVAKTSSNVKPRADIAYNGADDLFVVWRTASAVNFTAYNWFATQSSTGWALNISAQNVTVTADQDGRAHVAGVYQGDIFYTNCTINPSGRLPQACTICPR